MSNTTVTDRPDRDPGLDDLRRRRHEADHELGFHRDWPIADCPACQTGTTHSDTTAIRALRAAWNERTAA